MEAREDIGACKPLLNVARCAYLTPRTRRLGKLEVDGVPLFEQDHLFFLLQPAQAALRLPRFGGLGAKALRKLVDFRAAGRLALGLQLPVLHFHRAVLAVTIAVAPKLDQPLRFEREDSPDMPVQEISVVTNKDE